MIQVPPSIGTALLIVALLCLVGAVVVGERAQSMRPRRGRHHR